MKEDLTMTDLVALCKNRGFVFASSEIYGGLSNSWDYGPLGVELKNNLKAAWWRRFVQQEPHNVGLDSAIIMNPKVWKASGHLDGFSDPLIDCRHCHTRHRADKLIEEWLHAREKAGETIETGSVEAMSDEQLEAFISEHQIACPDCGKCDFTPIRKFNLMFRTFIGVTEDSVNTVYLRPETAGGIFVNFKNVQRATRSKMPMGVCQIGKAFRNEITPGNFIFRMREFEQMEMQFFCQPGTEMRWFEYWKKARRAWHEALGMGNENYRFHDHEKLAFYANAATDIEFRMPFGFKEVEGIHSRTNYDLSQHESFSGTKMRYFDPDKNESYVPYDIETSIGVDRMFLSVMCHAYNEEKLENGSMRVVLSLPAALAPIKCAVLPLVNKDGLPEKAQEIQDALKFHFTTHIDAKDSIGKRYRREDAIGTPYCVTVDGQTLEDNTVTLRHRDTMEQERVPVSSLLGIIEERVSITSVLKKLAKEIEKY